MKFYGHANLQKNQVQNAALEQVFVFPENPVVGQIVFLRRIVYICVQNTPAPPIWVPLTNEITTYTHVQEVASATWNVTHNLNTSSVNIQVFDGSNRVVIADEMIASSPNSATIQFAAPQAGRAVFVSGHFDGQVKPTYAYTHYQNTASTTWTINHGLGYVPIVRVFVGNDEVQPASITHPNNNTTVLTFTTAKAGYAKLI